MSEARVRVALLSCVYFPSTPTWRSDSRVALIFCAYPASPQPQLPAQLVTSSPLVKLDARSTPSSNSSPSSPSSHRLLDPRGVPGTSTLRPWHLSRSQPRTIAGILHPAFSTRHPPPGTLHLAALIQHPPSGTLHLAPSTWHPPPIRGMRVGKAKDLARELNSAIRSLNAVQGTQPGLEPVTSR